MVRLHIPGHDPEEPEKFSDMSPERRERLVETITKLFAAVAPPDMVFVFAVTSNQPGQQQVGVRANVHPDVAKTILRSIAMQS